MRFVNLHLADGRHVDLEVGDGVITSVRPTGDRAPEAPDVHDAEGRLALVPMVEPHAHLDKAMTADMVSNPTGDLAGAIEGWIAAAGRGAFTYDDMVARVRSALDRLLLSGVTAVRSHVNCVAGAAWNVQAVHEAIAPYDGVVDVQLVALPSTPLVGPDGAEQRAALARAIEDGVDLIGGCPHLEPDGAAVISLLLDAATDGELAVDLHVDETLDPTMLTLPLLARAVSERGFERSVAASHCVSLGVQDPATQSTVAAEVAAAGISVMALPQTNLFLQGREHPVGTPRGLTALHPLRDAGANVAAGGDNVQDPFNLVGRSDPMETAALLVMAGHVAPEDAYAMVSAAGRSALGLPPIRFEVGDPADFVLVDAPSVRAAIADAPVDRVVVRGGRVVAETTTDRVIRLDA